MATSYQQMRRRLRYSTTFFASVFTGNFSPHPSPGDGLQDGVQRGKDLPAVTEDQVRDHLRNLNVHKSMGLEKMQSQSPEGIG